MMLLGNQMSRALFLVMLCAVGVLGCARKESASGKTGQPTPTSLVGVEGCEGAILPTLETIEKGEYSPLARPLFVYVNSKSLQKPEVAGYLKTLLNEAQDKVEKSGFIKLNPKVLKEQQDKLNAAIAEVKFPEKLETGTVVVDGSSTVFPFSVSAAELFQK
jgi:ABC-type phosphate transport system substrate-binding protein